MKEDRKEMLLSMKEVNSNWSIEEKYYFHAKNKRGLLSVFDLECEKVEELIKAGVVASGWSFAYGKNNGVKERFLDIMNRESTNGELSMLITGLDYHVTEMKKKIIEVKKK